MIIGRKNKIEAAHIPKAPRVMEMSNINFGLPDALFRSYQHSPCAEKFHRYLNEKTGIETVATFAYGSLDDFPQMQLYIWVKDSDVTEQILHNTPYQSCRREHPLFCSIMDCLLCALRDDNNRVLSDVSSLWNMQQIADASGENKIYVTITILSYLRCYTDELLGATKEAVSLAFAEHFPSYERLMCGSYSLEGGPLAHNHLYLFLTPEDQEKAKLSGDIEKMREMAYNIIKEKDIYGYLPFEMYAPEITNRRVLTSEQIFVIARE